MIGQKAAKIVAALREGPRTRDPLTKLRWIFALFAVANAVAAGVAIVVATGAAPLPLRIAALAAALVLAAVWVEVFADGELEIVDDLVQIACLAAIAACVVASHTAEAGLGVASAVLLMSSLYGSLVRVLIRGIALGAFVVAPVYAGQTDVAVGVFVPIVFLLIGAATHAIPTFVGRYEEGVRREQILASTGLALVAAVDLPGIVHSSVDAACALSGSMPDARVWLAMADAVARPDPNVQQEPGDDPLADLSAAAQAGPQPPAPLKILAVAGAGDVECEGRTIDLSLLPNFAGALTSQRTVNVSAADAERLAAAGLAIAGDKLLLTPISVDGQPRGFLAIETSARIPGDLAASIRALVTQISLAVSRSDLQRDALERRSSERFRALVQNSTDVITIVDHEGHVRYVSPSVGPVFGYSEEILVGAYIGEIIHPEEVESVAAAFLVVAADPTQSLVTECRVRHADGRWCDTETRVTNLLNEPSVAGLVLNTRDITERHKLENELRHQAFHDALTGLANRALFVNRVQHALERAHRDQGTIAVLFLDLDGFKKVNDSLGYAAGDAALVAVAERLRASVRAPDTVARLGADEFAILLDGLTSPGDATIAVERIMAVLRQPLALPAASVELQPHIGIAVSIGGDETPDELLRNGAVAMHRARTLDGGYTIFDPEMHAAALRRLEVESQLREAIEQGQLAVFYQPTFDLNSGHLTGVEALVRWQHPTRGLVPPLEFIPLAEETGLIVPLGRWVMREACRQVRRWQQEIPNDQPLCLSVNLSARQLRHPTLVRDVADALDDSGLLPGRLILELTESVLMVDTAATLHKLFQLKSIGVRLAIDDFGTGYSSFSYLRRFPIDILKIDKSFVDGVATEPTAGALVDAMIRIGKTLRMETVAEGVERAEQADHLRALKCDVGQGYLFSRPLPPDAFTQLLLERQRPANAGVGQVSAA